MFHTKLTHSIYIDLKGSVQMPWLSHGNEQTFRASGKNLVKLAIPLIGTHLANVALGITDVMMVGTRYLLWLR